MKNYMIDLGKKIFTATVVYMVSRDISDKIIEIRAKKRRYEIIDM